MGGEGWQQASRAQQLAGQHGYEYDTTSYVDNQAPKVHSESSMLAQRLNQLAQQRNELEQNVSTVIAQLLSHVNHQQEAHQSVYKGMNQELLKEKNRADTATQMVTELRASCNQYEKKMLAFESTAQELARLRDALSSACQQANNAVQDAASARQAESDAKQRLHQMENELSQAHANRSAAADQIGQLQQEVSRWKEMYMATQASGPHMGLFGPHGHMPGGLMLGPHGPSHGMDGAAGQDGPHHMGHPQQPALHGLPPLPHGMGPGGMLPPGMWMHGPSPLMWAPPHAVVHTPLPPPLPPAPAPTNPSPQPVLEGPAQQGTQQLPAEPPAQPQQAAPRPAAAPAPLARSSINSNPTRPASTDNMAYDAPALTPHVSQTSSAPLTSHPSYTSTSAPTSQASHTSITGRDVSPDAAHPPAATIPQAHSGQHLLGLLATPKPTASDAGVPPRPASRSSAPPANVQPSKQPQAPATAPGGAAAAAAAGGGKSGSSRSGRKRRSGGGGAKAPGSDASGDVAVSGSTHTDQNPVRPAAPAAPAPAPAVGLKKGGVTGGEDAQRSDTFQGRQQPGSGRQRYGKPGGKQGPP